MKKQLLSGALVILLSMGFILTGCASMQLVSVESETVRGPAQIRQGTDINPRDITVWGVYKDGKRKMVSITRSNIFFNSSVPGRQLVRVRVGGHEVSFTTEVMALRGLTVASPPKTTLFKQGQEPDKGWPGLEIRGEWVQMGSHVIPVSSCEITGYMKDQPGRQTIRVSYEGLTTTFNVDVRGMTSIQITQVPTKIDYLQGEALNLTGLRVVGIWDGFPQETLPITMNDITGYNPNNVGIQHVTVTKNGRSVHFDVEVFGLTSIELDKPPTKTNYYAGEPLNLTGIMVYGNYTGADPTKRKRVLIPAEQLTISGYDPNRIGDQQRVTVTVRGISANFFVNITAAPPPVSSTPPASQQPTPTPPAQGGNQRPGQGQQPAPTPTPPASQQPTPTPPAQGSNQRPGQGQQPAPTPTPAPPATVTPTPLPAPAPAQPAPTPTPSVSVTISPANPTVAVGSPLQLTATVTGATNTRVTWKVGSNPDGSGSTGNGTSINSSGKLTISANERNTVLYVTATSVADTSKKAIIAVTVILGNQGNR